MLGGTTAVFSLVLITPLLNILSSAGWIMMFSCTVVETGRKRFFVSLLERSFPKLKQTHIHALLSTLLNTWRETSTDRSLVFFLSAAPLPGMLPSKLQPPQSLQSFSFGSSGWALSYALHPHAVDWNFLQGRNPRSYLILPISQGSLPCISGYWKPCFLIFCLLCVFVVSGRCVDTVPDTLSWLRVEVQSSILFLNKIFVHFNERFVFLSFQITYVCLSQVSLWHHCLFVNIPKYILHIRCNVIYNIIQFNTYILFMQI